ncbi:MAG: hypothetical protein ABIW79_00030 [Gemmatimonas sp.]
MHRPPSLEASAEVVPAEVAARLLARASELDMQYGDDNAVVTQSVEIDLRAVTDLRKAAIEAGISRRAFDAAFAELGRVEQDRVPDVSRRPMRRSRMWGLVAAAVTVIAAGAIAVEQSRPWMPTAATVEEAFVLRCITAEEATPLVLSVVGDPRNTQLTIHTSAPRVLTIRTTPAQMRNVRAVLAEYEGTGSPAGCATAGPPVPP